MNQLVWLILFFPLLGFLAISLGQNRIPKNVSGIIASLMVLASFLMSVMIFFTPNFSAIEIKLFDWISAGGLSTSFALLIDQISIIMLLIITGVGFLIHVYSIGYMKEDENASRYFSYLNLFIFFMLLLVMGSNFLVMFVGWEGVGLCSYFLIGFWFKNTSFNRAANKAFIMNRIGDLGFLLGIIMIYNTFGSLSFRDVFDSAKSLSPGNPSIVAITILLFIGATGKSAQIPLYTWLPDAMAGPTPVSALIHAATMVTAGIYMIVRANVLYSLAPFTLSIITVIGMATALLSATIALAQSDIKKVLAYSTVSQLGYMFVALGLGAYSTSLFHVTTHAFFKALLFLAAGSVIHAMSGEQDIRNMGGLRKKLPITFLVFLIGTFAISGVPPFAGFFSKDEILAKAWIQSPILFVLLSITSVITAVYMFRLMFLTFYGSFRGSADQKSHLHESPRVMTIPLIVLAILSTLGGFLGLPEIFSERNRISEFISPLLSIPSFINTSAPSHTFEWTLVFVSIVVLAIIISATYRVFTKQAPQSGTATKSPFLRLLEEKYYVDEFYQKIIVGPLYKISDWFWKVVDTKIIDGIVNGVNKKIIWSGETLRLIQTGNIGSYIFMMVIGIIAVLLFNLIL